MPGGIKAVKIIYQILAWLSLIGCIIGGISMIVMGAAFQATGEEGAAVGMAMGAGMGIFYIILGIVTFILYFITAKGIANKKNYGKIMAIIFGILMLPGIPIGTVLGIVILINIFGEQGKAWFSDTVVEAATPVEPGPTA